VATHQWAAIEWVMSGTQKGDFPGMPATGKRFSAPAGLEHPRIRRRDDPPPVWLLGCRDVHETGRPAALAI